MVIAGFYYRDRLLRIFFHPSATSFPVIKTEVNDGEQIVELVNNLNIPWEIEFLPNQDILITERPGNLLIIGQDQRVITVQGVNHVGEGGLLGLALHPSFSTNHLIYLYLTSTLADQTINRVEQYQLENDRLTNRKVILEGIKGAVVHDGGRIAFGPDGNLYVTTGDAGVENLAQDQNSLNGKILRVKADGTIPTDNPFGSAVYSYGHRNVQGIVWDANGRLWATEHGRSGVASGLDELNLIEKGKNYGWPTIEGDQTAEGMVGPVMHSGAGETWAPSGITYQNNQLFFAGLRGESLYVVDIHDLKNITAKVYFREEFGRLRTAKYGPDGYLYLLTNNTDGRGQPKENDDKLIRISPQTFNSN
jgi:glucose/arabinose dehydrogenase